MSRKKQHERPQNMHLAFSYFLKTLKPWRIPILISLLLAIGATVCSIFGPNILGQITNIAVEDYQTTVLRAGGIMVLDS